MWHVNALHLGIASTWGCERATVFGKPGPYAGMIRIRFNGFAKKRHLRLRHPAGGERISQRRLTERPEPNLRTHSRVNLVE